ncbi:J domain-containing protein [Sporosarcina sp. FSL K6-3457]|uniref:J domain-containing protein n=1 Tax=Sporosarcina sp. FSL K6-3457 TaxID=2978204 RepID=UPI0030F533AA
MRDYYKVLGIDRNATQQEIKTAYRQLSKKHHPDVNDGSKKSEKIFKDVQEAYRVLKDTASRQTYDARLKGTSQSQADSNSDPTPKNKQAEVHKQQFDFGDLEKNFEHFFGFNPKTKEMSSAKQTSEKKNPIDTTELFERYFKK